MLRGNMVGRQCQLEWICPHYASLDASNAVVMVTYARTYWWRRAANATRQVTTAAAAAAAAGTRTIQFRSAADAPSMHVSLNARSSS